jgi:hypothetical protein
LSNQPSAAILVSTSRPRRQHRRRAPARGPQPRQQEHRAGGGELAELGDSICGLLADGYSMNAITAMGNLYAGSAMTPDDVKFVVQTSAAAYCPEYVQ